MSKFNTMFWKVLLIVVLVFGSFFASRFLYEEGFPWFAVLTVIISLFLITNLTYKLIKK